MVHKAIWFVILLLFFTSMDAKPLKAEEPAPSNEATTAGTSSTNDKISLAQVAPELYYQLRRYPKFYGDENTVRGGLFERSFLLDGIGGTRDFLVDTASISMSLLPSFSKAMSQEVRMTGRPGSTGRLITG